VILKTHEITIFLGCRKCIYLLLVVAVLFCKARGIRVVLGSRRDGLVARRSFDFFWDVDEVLVEAMFKTKDFLARKWKFNICLRLFSWKGEEMPFRDIYYKMFFQGSCIPCFILFLRTPAAPLSCENAGLFYIVASYCHSRQAPE
jgi:hypothetical protein